MKKVGRKALLTAEEREQLRIDYQRYLRIKQRYERLLARVAPSALARKYNVAPSTVIDYGTGRHKGEVGYGLESRRARPTKISA